MSTFPQPVISSTLGFFVTPIISVSNSSAVFSFTPNAGAQIITITGLRGDITSTGATIGSLLGNISMGGGVSGPQSVLSLGNIQQALANSSGFPRIAQVIAASNSPLFPSSGPLPASVPRNPDPSPTAANSLQVSFVEGFASAFRRASDEDGGNIGLQGTRLRVQLTNIPDGITLYAPRAVRNSSNFTTGAITPAGGQTVIVRVDTPNADGSGGNLLLEIPDQFDMITVSRGTANIVYEVTADDLFNTETINLFVVVVAAAQPSSIGPINGLVSLAPIGPPTTVPARPQFTFSVTPILNLSANQLTFAARPGSNPPSQTFSITNAGTGTLNWTVSIIAITGSNWLTVTPSSGTGNGTVTVTAISSSLAIGNYSATLLVTASGASNSPLTLPVTLTVAAAPTLLLNPSSLTFSGSPGSSPAPQQIAVTSLNATVSWSATAATSSGGNWLSLTTPSGATPGTISVSVSTAGLAAGTYQGTVSVSSPDASNSPQTVSVALILGTPSISLNPSSLVFTTSVGLAPAPQTFTIQNSGSGVLGWTAVPTTESGGNWLLVSPTTATAPSILTVTITSAGLAAGGYKGSITISALPGANATNSPRVLPVTLIIDAPFFASGAVVSAATFSTDAVVSPGSLASLFGTNLAKSTASAVFSAGVLPTTLAGTQVLVNEIPAPLLYVSPTQINFQLPAVGGTSAAVVVVSNGIRSLPVAVSLAAVVPGIFTAGATSQGAVLNEDSSLNSAQNPAVAGSVIQIYATGLGATNPAVPSGQPAGTSPLSLTVQMPIVLIGGVAAEVQFSGLAPGTVGLYQVNARVPTATAASPSVPLQIQSGGRTSNLVTIAVR